MIEVRIKKEKVDQYDLQGNWFKLPKSYEISQKRFLFTDYDFKIGDKVYTEETKEFILEFMKYRVWDMLQYD